MLGLPFPCLFFKDNLASEEGGLQHAAGVTQQGSQFPLWGLGKDAPGASAALGTRLLVQPFLHLSSESHLSPDCRSFLTRSPSWLQQ